MNYDWNNSIDIDKDFVYYFIKQIPYWFNRASSKETLKFGYELLVKFVIYMFNSNDETLFIINRLTYLYNVRLFEILGLNFNRNMSRKRISSYKTVPRYTLKSMYEVELRFIDILSK